MGERKPNGLKALKLSSIVEPPYNCFALPTTNGFSNVTVKVATGIGRDTSQPCAEIMCLTELGAGKPACLELEGWTFHPGCPRACTPSAAGRPTDRHSWPLQQLSPAFRIETVWAHLFFIVIYLVSFKSHPWLKLCPGEMLPVSFLI